MWCQNMKNSAGSVSHSILIFYFEVDTNKNDGRENTSLHDASMGNIVYSSLCTFMFPSDEQTRASRLAARRRTRRLNTWIMKHVAWYLQDGGLFVVFFLTA